MTKKLLFFLFLVIVIWFAIHLGLADALNLTHLQAHLAEYQNAFKVKPFVVVSFFFGLYVFLAAVSFPGALVLSLLAGAIFGTFYGTIIVSLASTIGATLAMWTSRFLIKDLVEKKYAEELNLINTNIKKDGPFYLLTLRLIPIFPFFIINLLLGVTNMSTVTYFFISMLGMLPASIIVVIAGKNFSEITSVKGILSPKMILSLILFGLLPLLFDQFIKKFKKHKLYKKFKRPSQFDYNLIVIGGGSAGLVTSYIASTLKAKVALIEKHKMGGDCLNTGCVPSKALIQTTKAFALKKKAEKLGFKKIEIDFDFLEIMERIKKTIREVEPHDSRERYTELGVDCIEEVAQILSPYEVKVGQKILTTQNIVIATGASPNIPAIKGKEKIDILTSNTIWNLKALPKRFVIIGGGPISCELAQAFARLGSAVSVIEKGGHLLSNEDSEASRLIEEQLVEEGVQLYLNTQADEFLIIENVKYLKVIKEGTLYQLPFDDVLLAVGRKPNVQGFGLEELALSIRENGSIETNEFLETNYPNIFACGDVTGPYQLTHMASHQAWYCSVNALLGKFKKFKVDYRVVPWCTYTDPEVATVGMNEKILKEKKIDYEITFFDLKELDRAIVDGETRGFVKIITAKGKDKILGATIVSSHASTMILEFISAMKYNKGLNTIMNTIHIYPTLGEANKYAAGLWKKNHAPIKVLKILEKYFKWMRS